LTAESQLRHPQDEGRKYFFLFSNEKYLSVFGQLSIRVYFTAAIYEEVLDYRETLGVKLTSQVFVDC